jgi:hypothetical protein
MTNLENKYDFSFLLLDYNRPNELSMVLNSIRKYVKLNYQIIVHANGGQQDYHYEMYNKGLFNKLILNKENNGAGYGAVDLFNYCNTDYGFYIEGDQTFLRNFEREELDLWISKIEKEGYEFISPIGMATQGNFSQRAFFANTLRYRELALEMPCGGPGPYSARETNESFTQKYLQKTKKLVNVDPPLCMDMGCFSCNINPDGSEWLHRTDTKQHWLTKGPVKEKHVYPQFNDQEWEQVLRDQKWNGEIPERLKNCSFVHWNVNINK